MFLILETASDEHLDHIEHRLELVDVLEFEFLPGLLGRLGALVVPERHDGGAGRFKFELLFRGAVPMSDHTDHTSELLFVGPHGNVVPPDLLTFRNRATE